MWIDPYFIDPYDPTVFTPPDPTFGSLATEAVVGGAEAAGGPGHDQMLAIDPYATDPIYYAPPPKVRPTPKPVKYQSWYYADLEPCLSTIMPT